MKYVLKADHDVFVKKHFEFMGRVEYTHRMLLLKLERIKKCIRLSDTNCIERIVVEIEEEIL